MQVYFTKFTRFSYPCTARDSTYATQYDGQQSRNGLMKYLVVKTALFSMTYNSYILGKSFSFHGIYNTNVVRITQTHWYLIQNCLSFPCVNHYCEQSLTLSQWSSSGNPVAIQYTCNLVPCIHWNATGENNVGSQCVSSVLPVVFQWLPSGLPLCFNYAD